MCSCANEVLIARMLRDAQHPKDLHNCFWKTFDHIMHSRYMQYYTHLNCLATAHKPKILAFPTLILTRQASQI